MFYSQRRRSRSFLDSFIEVILQIIAAPVILASQVAFAIYLLASTSFYYIWHGLRGLLEIISAPAALAFAFALRIPLSVLEPMAGMFYKMLPWLTRGLVALLRPLAKIMDWPLNYINKFVENGIKRFYSYLKTERGFSNNIARQMGFVANLAWICAAMTPMVYLSLAVTGLLGVSSLAGIAVSFAVGFSQVFINVKRFDDFTNDLESRFSATRPIESLGINLLWGFSWVLDTAVKAMAVAGVFLHNLSNAARAWVQPSLAVPRLEMKLPFFDKNYFTTLMKYGVQLEFIRSESERTYRGEAAPAESPSLTPVLERAMQEQDFNSFLYYISENYNPGYNNALLPEDFILGDEHPYSYEAFWGSRDPAAVAALENVDDSPLVSRFSSQLMTLPVYLENNNGEHTYMDFSDMIRILKEPKRDAVNRHTGEICCRNPDNRNPIRSIFDVKFDWELFARLRAARDAMPPRPANAVSADDLLRQRARALAGQVAQQHHAAVAEARTTPAPVLMAPRPPLAAVPVAANMDAHDPDDASMPRNAATLH